MGRYVPFSTVTQEALVYALKSLGLPCEEATVNQLLDGYRQLRAYPDVDRTLSRLPDHSRLAVLSNADDALLRTAIAHNRLEHHFEHVLSVDQVQQFKPAPAVYQLAVNTLGVPQEEIVFVSSNAWDVAGARAFGLTVYWINRHEVPMEQLGVAPDRTIRAFNEIL